MRYPIKHRTMELAYKIILFLHAFGGGLALLSGLGAIATKKGGAWHTRSGLVYYWSMMLVIVSGFYVGVARSNFFLLMIAIFSFYMAYTGKRSLRNKIGFSLNYWDLTVAFLGLIVSFIMIGLGVRILLVSGGLGSAPMLFVFGAILGFMSGEDFVNGLKKKTKPGGWLIKHVGRMGGSFIATSTAFLLVNIDIEPAWVIWPCPTVVGSVLITIAIRRLTAKMGSS